MRSFFKMFFARFLALVIFVLIGIFFMIIWIASIASTDKVRVGSNAVLVVDLSIPYQERMVDNPLAAFSSDQYDILAYMTLFASLRAPARTAQ